MTAPLDYQPVQEDPRRFESPVARIVAWTVIVASVAFVITAQYLPQIRGKKSANGPGGSAAVMQQLQIEFSARYAVGLRTLVKNIQNTGPDPTAQLVPQLRQQATTNLDRFEVAITLGELQGPAAALKELEKV